MTVEVALTLSAFLGMSSAVLLVYMLLSRRRDRLDERIGELTHPGEFGEAKAQLIGSSSVVQFTQAALPKMGEALMVSEEEQGLLKTRLMHAGYYGRQALPLFLGVKLLLIVSPALLGLLLASLGLVPMRPGVMGGGCLGVLGMVAPSMWLDSQKSNRQTRFRRALPDALDVLVICLEGGLSLTSALRRVSSELHTAHPALTLELNIVQREIQLGRAAGEALKQLGIRTDLEEVRSLASVVTQAERYGASLVRSLRVHADTLRLRRQQHAEAMAAKAGVKILFPTIFCIFPALFVVVIGPAVYRIIDVFSK